MAQYYLPEKKILKMLHVVRTSAIQNGYVLDVIIESTLDHGHIFFDFSVYFNNLKINKDEKIDVYIFLNDTLFIKHPWKILLKKLLSQLPLISKIPTAAAVGPVDAMGILLDKNNLVNEKHLSTFLFALNKEGAKIFNQIGSEITQISIGDQSWANLKIADDILLNITINSHLKIVDSIYAWPGLKNNHSESTLFSKLICVVAEYEFSKKLLSSPGFIIPINNGILIDNYYFIQRLKSKLLRLIKK